MEDFYYLLSFIVAAMAVFVVHPSLVKIAHLKSIVDNPDARKLNKVPVPVLGGVGVFFGIMFSLSVAGYYVEGMNIQLEHLTTRLLNVMAESL